MSNVFDKVRQQLAQGVLDDVKRTPRVPTVRSPTAGGVSHGASLMGAIAAAVVDLKTVVDNMQGAISPLDKSLNLRDLLQAGVIKIQAGNDIVGGGVITVGSGGSTVPTADFFGNPILIVPPTPTALKASGTYKAVILTWEYIAYGNHAYTEIWRSSVDNLATATLIGTSGGKVYVDENATTLGVLRYYWVRLVGTAPATAPGSYNATAGVPGGAGLIGNLDLGPLIVEAANLALGAVTTAKFASTIEPISLVSSVPGALVTKTVFNTADGKLYRWNGSAYVSTVAAPDITGLLTDAQLAAIAATKITGTLTDAQLSAIASTKITGTLTDAQLSAISAAKITGALVASQLAISIGGGNLAVNSSFENAASLTPWVHSGSTFTESISTTQKHHGAQTLKLVGSGGVDPFMYQSVPVQPSTQYVFTAWLYVQAITAGVTGNRSILIYDGFGSAQDVTLSAGHATGVWVRKQVTLVTNAAATALEVRLYAPNGTVYWDAVQVEQGDTATAYAPKPDEILPSTITTTEIADNAITTPKLVALAVAAGKIAANAISATELQAGSVITSKILAGNVTATEIAASTIVAGNIAAATITGTQIAAATIAAANIVANTITAGQIAASTITGTQIAAATIAAANIVANTITAGQIAASTITGTQIAATTIAAGNLIAGTITANELAANSVTLGKVAAGAINAAQINTGQIQATHMGANSIAVGTAAIQNAAINNAMMANLSVDTAQIVDLAVGTAKINNLAVDTAKLNNLAVTNAKIANLAVDTAQINGLAVTQAKIANLAVGTAQIIDASITNAKINDLSADKINAGAIRGINIQASTFTTKGSYLTTSAAAADATLNVKDTTDFASSGSGVLIDSTNDRDAFSWTGKTSTTLTGCSGVLAHNNGAVAIPLTKAMLINTAINEMRFYGDRGDGTVEELASIGTNNGPYDNVLTIGTQNLTTSAVVAQAKTNNPAAYIINNHATGGIGVAGQCAAGNGVAGFVTSGSSTSSAGVYGSASAGYGVRGISSGGPGVYGSSSSGPGGKFDGTSTFSQLLLSPLIGRPSDRTVGAVACIFTSGGTVDNRSGSPTLMVADGTNWRVVDGYAVWTG